MATYETSLSSPIEPDVLAHDFVDMRTFTRWDPGLERVELVEGAGPGVGTVYDVRASGLTLRYSTAEADLEAPVKVIRFVADGLLTSDDIITIEPNGAGSTIVYRAELGLGGPLALLGSLLDPLLGFAFERIGDRAATGLRDTYGTDAAVPATRGSR